MIGIWSSNSSIHILKWLCYNVFILYIFRSAKNKWNFVLIHDLVIPSLVTVRFFIRIWLVFDWIWFDWVGEIHGLFLIGFVLYLLRARSFHARVRIRSRFDLICMLWSLNDFMSLVVTYAVIWFSTLEYNSDHFQFEKNDSVFMQTVLSLKHVQIIFMPESWDIFDSRWLY